MPAQMTGMYGYQQQPMVRQAPTQSFGVVAPTTASSQYVPTNQQFQQFNQTYTIPGVPGRVVNCLEEITANDVVMDGRVSYFPTSDGSCIYAKAWRSDGTISTLKYVAEQTLLSEQQSDPFKDAFDNLNTRLDRIEKSLRVRRSHSKKPVKKELSENV